MGESTSESSNSEPSDAVADKIPTDQPVKIVVDDDSSSIEIHEEIPESELFENDSPNSHISFEIAFLTAITGMVFANPLHDSFSYLVLQAILFAATGLAVLRLLLVLNEQPPRESLLRYSRGIIEYSIFLGAVYLLSRLITSIAPFSPVSVPVLFIVATISIGVILNFTLSRVVEGVHVYSAVRYYNLAVSSRNPLLQWFANRRAMQSLRKVPDDLSFPSADTIASFEPRNVSDATTRDWVLFGLTFLIPWGARGGMVVLGTIVFGNFLISIGLLASVHVLHETPRFLFYRYGFRTRHDSAYYRVLFGLWAPVYLFSHSLVMV